MVEGLGFPVNLTPVHPADPRSTVLLSRNVEQFRGRLVFQAHRLVYHSTLGLRVIKKKKKVDRGGGKRFSGWLAVRRSSGPGRDSGSGQENVQGVVFNQKIRV